MNNKNKTLLILMALFTITFTACKDDEETIITPEEETVEFTFTNPSDGTMYGLNDTVHIDGMISWENELHGYELTLTNMSVDSVVYTSHAHEDASTIHVHTLWVNNVINHSDMKLTIDAFTDHDGTKETKEIEFHCHPM